MPCYPVRRAMICGWLVLQYNGWRFYSLLLAPSRNGASSTALKSLLRDTADTAVRSDRETP